MERRIQGKRLVYLDNAATSQKPQAVIDALVDYYSGHNANVHRGIHTLSEEATRMYEEARVKVQKFVNARHPEEIIFTRGTTESINFVASAWGRQNITQNDSLLITEVEHHSNLIPWQVLASEKGCGLEILPIDDEGFVINDAGFPKDLKVLALSHASNVLGAVQDVKSLVKMAHDVGALVVVDGAQAVPHFKVDVQSLGCDFYAFSGHKMLGPTGIGVLYVRKEILENLSPYQFGGGMIKEVSYSTSTYADPPEKFEAGTPNVAGAVGLGAALDYLNSIGMENIANHEAGLVKYALEKLTEVPGLEIIGPKGVEKRVGVVSFVVADLHPHDIASVLDSEGVAVRSGHHCAMPLHRKMNIPASTRASFYLYNSKEDVDELVKGLKKSTQILRIK